MSTHHRKGNRKTKWLAWLILAAVLVGASFFLFGSSTTRFVNDNDGKATSTPGVVKPKPKPPTTPRISVLPSAVKQGEPAIITVEGIASTTNIASFTYNNRPLNFFLYEGYVTAFIGIDLYAATGTFPLLLTFKDGTQMKGSFTVHERPLVTGPFEIPEKLGGNTPESIRTLVTTLAAEGKIINALPSEYKRLWSGKFRFPLDGGSLIDDPYGYTRVIGAFTMPHKGTDYVADIGTPVHAMNTGVVRLASSLRNYGDTVIIDHGAGIQSVYMHLSSIGVTVGQNLERGDVIGLTGDTGYTTHPHLHLTMRIWDISVDPVKFLDLFGENR